VTNLKLFKTINVPVVYMARDVMILMWPISIAQATGRGGPWNQEFLGSEMAMSEAIAISEPKKLEISGSNCSNSLSNGFALIKIIKSKCHIKK
jgi:hypothetical protein